MSGFITKEACAACGCDMEGMIGKGQIKGAMLCSRSCAMIHAKHFRDEFRQMVSELNRKYWG